MFACGSGASATSTDKSGELCRCGGLLMTSNSGSLTKSRGGSKSAMFLFLCVNIFAKEVFLGCLGSCSSIPLGSGGS